MAGGGQLAGDGACGADHIARRCGHGDGEALCGRLADARQLPNDGVVDIAKGERHDGHRRPVEAGLEETKPRAHRRECAGRARTRSVAFSYALGQHARVVSARQQNENARAVGRLPLRGALLNQLRRRVDCGGQDGAPPPRKNGGHLLGEELYRRSLVRRERVQAAEYLCTPFTSQTGALSKRATQSRFPMGQHQTWNVTAPAPLPSQLYSK